MLATLLLKYPRERKSHPHPPSPRFKSHSFTHSYIKRIMISSHDVSLIFFFPFPFVHCCHNCSRTCSSSMGLGWVGLHRFHLVVVTHLSFLFLQVPFLPSLLPPSFFVSSFSLSLSLCVCVGGILPDSENNNSKQKKNASYLDMSTYMTARVKKRKKEQTEKKDKKRWNAKKELWEYDMTDIQCT